MFSVASGPGDRFVTVCLVAVVVVSGAVCFLALRRLPRWKHFLLKWADERGFEILDAKRRWLRGGPYSWFLIGGQTVYRITVRDGHGKDVKGYVCIESFLRKVAFRGPRESGVGLTGAPSQNPRDRTPIRRWERLHAAIGSDV